MFMSDSFHFSSWSVGVHCSRSVDFMVCGQADLSPIDIMLLMEVLSDHDTLIDAHFKL
jgi:hypothetical protein